MSKQLAHLDLHRVISYFALDLLITMIDLDLSEEKNAILFLGNEHDGSFNQS
ncbi:hypothetical protein [Undibacterium sp. Ji22W]|uniref:hypothetical protein n=1 Tax=Undibacterium sp. Ji22W TaxID=3413038 RepID=UPI003BF08465